MLAEDEALLGGALREGLQQEGFAVDLFRDGAAARAALETEQFAGIVLDLGLPRLTGLELLRWLRASRNVTPVLVLTARDALEDRVKGLDLGADDYVVKPAAIAEIAARLRALIRRSQGLASGTLTVGDVTLNMASRSVECRGQPVELSAREFAVLRELMLNAGRVLTRDRASECAVRAARALHRQREAIHGRCSARASQSGRRHSRTGRGIPWRQRPKRGARQPIEHCCLLSATVALGGPIARTR